VVVGFGWIRLDLVGLGWTEPDPVKPNGTFGDEPRQRRWLPVGILPVSPLDSRAIKHLQNLDPLGDPLESVRDPLGLMIKEEFTAA
jgi:hypothetical protein